MGTAEFFVKEAETVIKQQIFDVFNVGPALNGGSK